MSTLKPKLQITTLEKGPSKEAKTKQFKIKFKAEYDLYRKHELAYQNNVTKAYALLWEWCTKGMKNQIEAWLEFTSKIENNPIDLLKAIKEHLLNYQEHCYNVSIILDAMKTLLGTKQKEVESLQDYTKRFRVA